MSTSSASRGGFLDIESQSSSLLEEDEPELERVNVRVSMDEAQRKKWIAETNTYPVCVKGHRHMHPFLAAARSVGEEYAMKEALKVESALVVDVGGAPHRTFATLGERGRYVMPRLQPGDDMRWRSAPEKAKQYICKHRIQDCRCYGEEARVLVGVHSLGYYVEPLALWHLIQQPGVVDVLVVEHEFSEVYGGFYDEATYQLDGCTVSMAVHGNQTPYHHHLPPWQSGWRGPNGEAFYAEPLISIMNFTFVRRIAGYECWPSACSEAQSGDFWRRPFGACPVFIRAEGRYCG